MPLMYVCNAPCGAKIPCIINVSKGVPSRCDCTKNGDEVMIKAAGNMVDNEHYKEILFVPIN